MLSTPLFLICTCLQVHEATGDFKDVKYVSEKSGTISLEVNLLQE